MSTPPPGFRTAALVAETSRLAHTLADQAAVADIECEGLATTLPDSLEQWYDTTPMLSPNEHSGPVIDMATQALAYARLRGLIVHHPRLPHLVRIVHHP